MDQALALLASLGMDHAFIATNGRDAPTSMAAAARAGAIGISGEFGGGGTLTPATLAATQRAIDQLLLALGVIDAPVLGPHAPADGGHAAAGPGQPRPGHLRHASRLVRARRGHRRQVSAGDLAGYYHDLNRLDAPEEALRFGVSGIVISRRLHTDSEAGDCLIQVARPVEQADILAAA